MRLPLSIFGCTACLSLAQLAAAQPMEPAPLPAPATGSAPAGADRKWYDVVDFGAFVDAYYSHNWRRPRPNGGANLYQPYTPNTGFSLAWLGLDASVNPDPVGAVLQLRFGPSTPNLALSDFAILARSVAGAVWGPVAFFILSLVATKTVGLSDKSGGFFHNRGVPHPWFFPSRG